MSEGMGPAAAAVTVAEVKTKEPKNKSITQQNLPACKPVLDKTWVIFIFISIAIVLIPIGVVCLIFGAKPVEESFRYDQYCLPQYPDNDARQLHLQRNANNETALQCVFNITLTKDISGPVFVYVELDKMYQNHRRYVRSRSDLQLANQDGALQTSYCAPQEYFGDNSSQLINPCGLTAWSFFNDTYALTLSRNNAQSPLPVSTNGIAFPSDVKYLFGSQAPNQFFNPPGADRGGARFNTSLNSNEQFVNWMRLSALPTFRKLWYKIDQDLRQGDVVQVAVLNRYNTYSFDGAKTLVLGNTTWLGGSNIFLGVVYIVTGGLSMLLGLLYTLMVSVKPRPFGDVSALKPM